MNVPASPTAALAGFAAGLDYRRLPESIQGLLFELSIDYLRVASLGERMPWSDWARDYVRQTGGQGGAPVLYSALRTDPVSAAFLNTVYAGSIDADDTHVGAMLHPGCIVFSAALAIGQARGLSGHRVLAAVVAGYEAMIRIGLSVQPSHFKRGFQSTATCGVFGSAVAAAALLFPGDAARIAGTIGMAASFSGGLVQFFHSGSTVKRVHAAQAARAGVQAALLAEAGFSGPADILEGQDGFARAYSDGFDFAPLFDGLGTAFRMTEVLVKPHACSARTQSAVEAAATLCREHGIGAADIAAITLGIPSVIQGRLTGTEPRSLQAAQMSAPFCIAVAIRKESRSPAFTLNVDDFEAGLQDPVVTQLSAKVSCVLDDEVERTSAAESVSARVTLHLNDGRELTGFVLAPKGSASRPFTRQDHVDRAAEELGRRYAPEQVAALMDDMRRLPELADTSTLAQRLAG
ncbi:MmgE/PrpD family protein [Pigmentiphaga soli]|uniref:MmgE/PrpD family protein n=1 Tax=Pigmentiphaga soli TaxID=1007095 RepID=A0ABP8H1G6_9BURK